MKCGVCGEGKHYGRCDRNLMRLLKEVRAERDAALSSVKDSQEMLRSIAEMRTKLDNQVWLDRIRDSAELSASTWIAQSGDAWEILGPAQVLDGLVKKGKFNKKDYMREYMRKRRQK